MHHGSQKQARVTKEARDGEKKEGNQKGQDTSSNKQTKEERAKTALLKNCMAVLKRTLGGDDRATEFVNKLSKNWVESRLMNDVGIHGTGKGRP